MEEWLKLANFSNSSSLKALKLKSKKRMPKGRLNTRRLPQWNPRNPPTHPSSPRMSQKGRQMKNCLNSMPTAFFQGHSPTGVKIAASSSLAPPLLPFSAAFTQCSGYSCPTFCSSCSMCQPIDRPSTSTPLAFSCWASAACSSKPWSLGYLPTLVKRSPGTSDCRSLLKY